MKRLSIIILLILAAFPVAMAQSAQTATVKLEGQVVCCKDCWAKADRKTTPYGTRADLEKAADCVANGDPTLLAIANDDAGFIFYELEPGKFKRAGKNWLDYVGKRVEVTGLIGKKKDNAYIRVDALTILAEPVAATEPEPNAIGAEVELALKDLSGIDQRLSAYRGRIIILNFWATYCVPCRKEMPDLVTVQNQYAALGVQVIGAAADTADDKQKVMQFIKDTKLNFPVWLGASAGDMQQFGLSSTLPATVIIDRNGKTAAIFRSIIKLSEVKKHIDRLLASAEERTNQQVVAVTEKPNNASSVPS